MTKAKGNFDFLSSECVVGTALSVERTYFGGQLECGDGVTLDYNVSVLVHFQKLLRLTFGGRIMGGGSASSSATFRG